MHSTLKSVGWSYPITTVDLDRTAVQFLPLCQTGLFSPNFLEAKL